MLSQITEEKIRESANELGELIQCESKPGMTLCDKVLEFIDRNPGVQISTIEKEFNDTNYLSWILNAGKKEGRIFFLKNSWYSYDYIQKMNELCKEIKRIETSKIPIIKHLSKKEFQVRKDTRQFYKEISSYSLDDD